MKIRYKISSFSSENPSNPVINLVSGAGNWQSARFCTYPQQITLLFSQPVIIKKIKIVAHQNKVPQKMNLLYHLPSTDNQNQFTKIGYITFKAPSESIPEQSLERKNVLREMKVINDLELKTLYLRLILYANHPCKTNVFNQVGLSSVLIEGIGCEFNFPKIELKNDSFVQIKNLGKDKIMLLKQFKQRCVEKQQYKQAKQIKQIIDQVSQLLEQIKELNQEKIKQVHEQNYTRAKQIKEQISKLKQKIEYMANNFYNPQSNTVNKFSIDIDRNKDVMKESNLMEKPFNNEFMKETNNNEEITEKRQSHQSLLNETALQGQQNQQVQNESTIKTSYQYEHQVVPALLNRLNKSSLKSDTQELSESRIQQNLPPQPEELSPSNEANSSILTEFYQKLTIRKLYSKYWQFKNQALEQIVQDAKKKTNTLISKNQLRAFIFVYNRIMAKENNKQLILSVIQMIDFVIGMKIQEGDFKSQMTRQLEKSVIQTLEKTQQNQHPKIKAQAEKVIIKMIEGQIYGNLLVYHAIIKAYDDKISAKLKIIYLDTLSNVASNSSKVKNQIPVSIINFTMKKMSDANNRVRKSAINLLKELTKQGFKDQIKISITQQKSLKQSQIKELGFQ